jgi:uncharacterized protein (TIGR02186 family)
MRLSRLRRCRAALLALAASLLCGALPARAAMIAELSDHTISIRTDFQGENILLFGTTGTPLLPSDNLVATIKGPQEAVIVREKIRTGPVWHNAGFVRFEGIYSFFQIYTARPLDPALSASVLGVQDLRLETLPLPVSVAELGPQQTLPAFAAALRQHKATEGLYTQTNGVMTVIDSLFWTTLRIPRNVPTGRYIVDVFLIRDGQVAGAIRLPLDVFKDGVGAEIFLFAHRQPLLYGIFGVVLAAGTGLLVSWIFRKIA